MNKDNPLEERLNGLRLQNLHEEVQERMNLWRINHPKQEPDIAQLQEFFDDVLLQGNQLLLNGKPRLFGAMTDEEQLNAGLPFGPAGETLTLGSIPVDEFQRIEGSIRRVNKELELAGQTPRPVTQSLVLQEYAKKLAATKGARDARTNEETERIWAEWVKSGGLNR